MTRRVFSVTAAAAMLSFLLCKRHQSILKAVAGVSLPCRIVVPQTLTAPLYEIRSYGGVSPRMLRIFARHGVDATLQDEALLIPFASLQAREQSWNQVNADPDWQALRDELGPAAYTFALYEVI